MAKAKLEIQQALSNVGVEIGLDEIKESPKADYGVPVGFLLAKQKKKIPQDLSTEIAQKIECIGLIKEAMADGGYVNFNLDYISFTKNLLETLKTKGGDFGKSKTPATGKTILEHTSVNPSGPIHVGRLRNTLIGDSLGRILKFYGQKIETHYYVNDIGKQIAIIGNGLKLAVEQDIEASTKYVHFGHKKDFQVFFTYVTANQLYDKDKEFAQSVDQLILDAENGDAQALDTITSAAKKALEGQGETFERLGVSFDFYDFESDDLREGRVEKVLRRIKKSDIAVEDTIGAGVDLSKWGIEKKGGMTVVERSDGTSVYLARDVTYHLEKIKLGDRLINVLGEDHKLQAQELSIILHEVFNINTPIDVVHFSFVNFEGKQFSTRKGEIAAVDMLLDEAEEKARIEIESRGIGDPEDAPVIGIGAVKFGILKTVPQKQIHFKWGKVLNFEGETAAYIQYAHARSARILEKSEIDVDSIKLEDVSMEPENNEEKKLILELSRFPEVIEESVNTLRPDLVCQYLLSLTSTFGGFYMKCPVIEAEPEIQNRRILLTNYTKQIIKTGLGLLGIDAPERM